MTGLVLGETVPALDNPEPTETKLGRAWGAAVDWGQIQATASEPTKAISAPLSRERLRDSAERAYAPQWYTGSFRVPYGMKAHQLEALCKEMTSRWLAEMQRQGYDIASGTRLIVTPGPNPSRDLASGLIVPGYRDFLLTAQFVVRHPETIRIEVPGSLFEPWSPHQLPTSSGDEGA